MPKLSTDLLIELFNSFVLLGLLLGHDNFLSAPIVALENPKTNLKKEIPVGWNWWCFISPALLGIPSFFQGLYLWGVLAMLGAIVPSFLAVTYRHGLDLFPARLELCFIIFARIALFIMQIWLGLKGSKILAKHYISDGWTFANPESRSTRFAREKWGLI